MNDVLVFIVGYATGMISCVLIIFTLMKKPKGNQELGDGCVERPDLKMVVDNDGGIRDDKNE